MRNKPVKLNFGCGLDVKEGFINIDIDSNMKMDMNCFPYPFETDSVDYILCNHVLEHLSKPTEVISEFFRILKPKGKCKISVPHFTSFNALYGDVHINSFNLKYFSDMIKNRKTIFGNKLPSKLWINPKAPQFSSVSMKLVFYFKNFSLLKVFNFNRITQLLYEIFFSLYFRCNEIIIIFEK